MKTLVTGGLGAVGAPLVTELRKRGHEVHVMDLPHHHGAQYHRGNVGEYRQLERVIEEVGPEMVYHLGAEFGRWNGERFYETMWSSNAIGTKHVIRLQERERFRMVFFSSSEVYGDHDGVMVEDVLDRTPLRQMNDYAISKWVNEMQVMNSADRHGTETVRVRLFNTYGPGERYSDYRSVVCLFTYRALKRLPFTVYATHSRTLTYIDDCVQALANVQENFRAGEVYNIAGDECVGLKTLADMVLERTGAPATLARIEEVEAHNTLHKRTSNAKAKAHLGFKPAVSLDEGLDRTVAWMREEYGA
jgi:dTDP-glucose 4,6-dehydratase